MYFQGKPGILAYLSGGARVSTKYEAEASGPRAHVIGVMDAFHRNGWQIEPYIVGDYVPNNWIRGSENKLGSSLFKRIGADVVRVAMGEWHSRKAWKLLGNRCHWAYERFAAYQMLGLNFKRNGIPWIVETNAPLFYEAKTARNSIAFSRWARQREVLVYREADVLVTITEALKEIVADVAGISVHKILVIPNAVDTLRFDPSITVPRRIFTGPTIGFVGSLIGWQALDILIDTVSELQSEGIFWNIVVAGDGPMLSEWERYARKVKIAERISFLGRVPWPDVPRLIAGFDLCYSGQVELQIGKMYLSPLKLYEYLAMGKPVIASAFEDSKRLVLPGKTGFLFKGGDKHSLKNALREAWRARESWHEMGSKGRELIVHGHSWERRVRDMIFQIEKVLAEKKGGHFA